MTPSTPPRSMSAMVNTSTPSSRIRSPRHGRASGSRPEPLSRSTEPGTWQSRTRRRLAECSRQRHAVDVPARRRVGPVEVAVRVDPQRGAGAARLPPSRRVSPSRSSGRHRARAAGTLRSTPRRRTARISRTPPGSARDSGREDRLRCRLGNGDGHIAAIETPRPRARIASIQLGVANRGRAHVDAAPTCAEVKPRSDDRDRTRGPGDLGDGRHGPRICPSSL